MPNVSEGFCQCGCGQKTSPAEYSDKSRGWIKGKFKKFIHGHNVTRRNHPQWKNGRMIQGNGYVMITVHNHPRANKWGYVLEHIIIAEKVLGKSLPPKAEIHHYNGKKDNKSIIICQDHAYHCLLHQRTRALRTCGHTNWLKCPYCKQYDAPENLHISRKTIYHHKCALKYSRDHRERYNELQNIRRKKKREELMKNLSLEMQR